MPLAGDDDDELLPLFTVNLTLAYLVAIPWFASVRLNRGLSFYVGNPEAPAVII